MDTKIECMVEDLQKREIITKTKSQLEEERKIKDIPIHAEKYMQHIAYMLHTNDNCAVIVREIPLDQTKYAQAIVDYIHANSSYKASIKYEYMDFPYGSSDIKVAMYILVKNPNIITSTFWEKVAKTDFFQKVAKMLFGTA